MAESWIAKFSVSFPLILAFLGVATTNGPLVGLGLILLLAGFVARTWSKNVLKRLTYTRIIPEDRAFPGEPLTVTLRVVNDKLLPVPWLEVRDLVPEALPLRDEHLSPSTSHQALYLSRSTHLSWYERVSWPLQFEAPARGYYRLGPARFSSGDIFGLFPVERHDDHYDSIVVYPRLYTLPELGLPAERPFGEQKGRERIFEDPGRIAGSRDYHPGDPMRRIDWKATARRQALQSKVYEPSATLHMLIALNVHTLEHVWEGYLPELLERLLSVAGSVARHGFEEGYAIGLVANGAYPTSDRPMRVPVGRRSEQLMRVLEALAVIGPLTLTPLEKVLDREAQAFPYGATLVCVTARMDEPLAASLRRIAAAGHTVIVLSLAGEMPRARPARQRAPDSFRIIASIESEEANRALFARPESTFLPPEPWTSRPADAEEEEPDPTGEAWHQLGDRVRVFSLSEALLALEAQGYDP